MFGIGVGELVFILVIVFLVSPKELPKVMRKAGWFFRLMNRFREDVADIGAEVGEVVKSADPEDPEAAGRPR